MHPMSCKLAACLFSSSGIFPLAQNLSYSNYAAVSIGEEWFDLARRLSPLLKHVNVFRVAVMTERLDREPSKF
jgi:hypothetical protein